MNRLNSVFGSITLLSLLSLLIVFAAGTSSGSEPPRQRVMRPARQTAGADARPTDAAKRPVGAVVTGLDALIGSDFAALRGRRVGLITNQSGRTRDGRSAIDVLWQAAQGANGTGGANAAGAMGAAGAKSAFTLAALFSPEHGLRGRASAGASVDSSRDGATGLPLYSLYGKTLKPTSAMLRNMDTLVFDIQDIGSRSYTYISTLGLCMEAAAIHHLRFVVLDRPNPLGGERVEGNIPAPAFRSFVGRYALPYLHGLTVGELARLLNGERLLAGGAKCDLTVIPMQNWRRGMTWDETGLAWTPTSPNVPYARTALYYAATGTVGELPALSIGIGTPLPFEYVGCPGLDAAKYAANLTRRDLSGVVCTPAAWTPAHGVYAGHKCAGVHIAFTDPDRCDLTRLNFELMDAARAVMPSLRWFRDAETTRMFDLVNGTDAVRKGFASGAASAQLWADWNSASPSFRLRRKPYLLYP